MKDVFPECRKPEKQIHSKTDTKVTSIYLKEHQSVTHKDVKYKDKILRKKNKQM